MTFWDSLDSLHKLNSILLVSWVVISALFGLLSWKIQARITELSSKKEKQLEVKVESSEKKASTFEDKSIEFEKKLAESEKIRLETEQKLKQEIEQTNKSLSETKQKVAPREFTNEQKQKFISFLNDKPKGKLSVTAIMGDGESMGFAQQIENLLKQAGYSTDGISQAVFTGTPKGIILVVKNETTAPLYAGFIQKAFEQIGINAPGEQNLQYAEYSLNIIVGHKNN